jgi:hypothetical protein
MGNFSEASSESPLNILWFYQGNYKHSAYQLVMLHTHLFQVFKNHWTSKIWYQNSQPISLYEIALPNLTFIDYDWTNESREMTNLNQHDEISYFLL